MRLEASHSLSLMSFSFNMSMWTLVDMSVANLGINSFWLLNVRALELFHAQTLTGKMSAHEFYKCLEHLTDNTELSVPKVRTSVMS